MCRNFRRPTGQVRVGLPWDSKPATKRGRQPRRERKRVNKPASPLFSSETVSPTLRESRDADKMETGTGSELFRSAFNPSNTPPPAFNPSQAFNPSSSTQNFFVPSSSFGSSGQFFSSPGNRGQRQFVDQVIFVNFLDDKGSAFFEPAILG